MENPAAPPKRGKLIIVALVLLVIFGIAYALVLRSYIKEGGQRVASVTHEGERSPNHIEVSVKIVSVDPIKGDVVMRLEFEPHGNLTTDEGTTLARDLRLYVNSATGRQEHDFARGKRMNPLEVVVDMYEGEVMDYPFDSHRAQLMLYMEVPTPAAPAGAAAGASSGAGASASPPAAAASPAAAAEEGAEPRATPEPPDEDDIPLVVELYGSISGLEIEATRTRESTPTFVAIDMEIERASTVRFFSTFIMTAMWLLALAVLFLTLWVALGGRKVELAMFSFLGALLFAFPALRNSQPGTPPIGTLSDFIAFFWAEMIIALCLLTLLALWLKRAPK